MDTAVIDKHSADFPESAVDILEQDIWDISPFLLQDKTTGKNILWACEEYSKYGVFYAAEKEILPELITGANTKIIQPRVSKNKEEQKNRTRKSAEVFTPSWICNQMNNVCDEEWFGRKDVFNVENGHEWTSVNRPVAFEIENKKSLSWNRYIDSKRLEITCGEAPYLVSRYDTTTGNPISIERRIGVLDRKLRVVGENTATETDWFIWARRAFESTYGYEYQGDNLLLARENLLYTFADYYAAKFNKNAPLILLKQIANIIAWNIWQMDGLTDCAPFSRDEAGCQLDLFSDNTDISANSPCQIKDWRSKKIITFNDIKGTNIMKFDFVIGNPPYQISDGGSAGGAVPVYQKLVEQAICLNPRYLSMIIPARWFAGGRGLEEFRNNMLSDSSIKMLVDYPKSRDCFQGVDIAGGVCYFLREKGYNGLCNVISKTGKAVTVRQRKLNEFNIFVRDNIGIDIIHKVKKISKNSFSEKVLPVSPFGLRSFVRGKDEKFKDCLTLISSAGKSFISQKDVKKGKELIDKYKVSVGYLNPDRAGVNNASDGKSNVTTKIKILNPKEVITETYIILSCFDDRIDAENCVSYVKTKFFRYLVLLTLSSMHLTKLNFQFVPMQNFSKAWTDEELYKKYALSDEEIAFIEKNVKEMV